jgi:oligoendopeptidase F
MIIHSKKKSPKAGNVLSFARPLFKNQQDLVTHIIQEANTEYYVANDDIEKFNRTLNRLKAYVSQLLSSNVTRTVTGDFESALRNVINKKNQ